MIRHRAEDGSYLEHELFPRRTRDDGRNVEACCRIDTGPASYPTHIFDPRLLADIGWALLTAAHKLNRLQGGASLAEVGDDPQLTIFDAGAHR
jgi:hypothetical protein